MNLAERKKQVANRNKKKSVISLDIFSLLFFFWTRVRVMIIFRLVFALFSSSVVVYLEMELNVIHVNESLMQKIGGKKKPNVFAARRAFCRYSIESKTI